MRPIVAIDGPAGAGKSSVARKVADELGFVLVDTGAIYRAVALAAKRSAIDWASEEAVGELAERLVRESALRFERDPADGILLFLLNEDVSSPIRTQEIARGASQVSAHPRVRQALLDLQRQLGRQGAVVLEGRDIGTVVFPNADCKFFLTASVDVRGRRRFDELRAKGENVSVDEVVTEVRNRDAQDEGRATAPLRRAEDAILIDSSAMTVDEVVRAMVARVREVMARG